MTGLIISLPLPSRLRRHHCLAAALRLQEGPPRLRSRCCWSGHPQSPTPTSFPCVATAIPCAVTTVSCVAIAFPCVATAFPCVATAFPCVATAFPCVATAFPCVATAYQCTRLVRRSLNRGRQMAVGLAGPALCRCAHCYTLAAPSAQLTAHRSQPTDYSLQLITHSS